MLAKSSGINFRSQSETAYNRSFRLRVETTALLTSSRKRKRSRSSERSRWGAWRSIEAKDYTYLTLPAKLGYSSAFPNLPMESTVKHLTMEELEAALDHLRQAPKDDGVLQLIVRRPKVDEREVLDEAELDPVLGLIGDDWHVRGSRRTPDGSAHPEMQINIMNARVTALVAQDKDRWPL